MIFVKPAKFLAPLGPQGPAVGLRGGLCEGREAAAMTKVRGESVFEFTATVEMEAAVVQTRWLSSVVGQRLNGQNRAPWERLQHQHSTCPI